MGQFATRCGTVEKIQDGRATVRLDAPTAGGECATCGAGCCGGMGGGRASRVTVAAPDGLDSGEKVYVRMWIPSPGWSVSAIFLIPLLCLGLGAGLWTAASSAGIAPESDALALLAGVSLMALWYVGLAVYERRAARSTERAPRIVERPPMLE